MDLKNKLRERLQQSLPGHFRAENMTPEGRKIQYKQSILNEARKSAVMCIISVPSNPHITLIQRPSYKGVHSGQISFPGGKVEEYDESLLHTATRETEEEIGLSVHRYDVLGPMSPVYIPPSNFFVQPYIGWCEEDIQYTRDEREVEEILVLPVKEFFEEKNIKVKSFFSKTFGREVEYPYYDIQSREIWGATAMMISELVALFEDL